LPGTILAIPSIGNRVRYGCLQDPAGFGQWKGAIPVSAWVEVDLSVISENVRRFRQFVGPRVRVLGVVKSNAYGYGLVPVAGAALRGGALWLGVGSIGEGVALREAGISAPVLVFGRPGVPLARVVVEYGLSQAVGDEEMALALSSWACKLSKPARIHIDIDTGMGTTGMRPEDIPVFAERLRSVPGLVVEGSFTHFANTWITDPGPCEAQIDSYISALKALKNAGIDPGIRHACNTGGISLVPRAHLDMVRPGAGIHGMWPFPFPDPIGLTESMTFKARVEVVRVLPEGAAVSYTSLFHCSHPTTVAWVGLGFAEGLPRRMTNSGGVLIHGRRAPIVGAVCMNRFAVDVTDIAGVRPGDEVVICGRQGSENITVAQAAMSAGVNVGEFLLPYRLPKTYLGEKG